MSVSSLAAEVRALRKHIEARRAGRRRDLSGYASDPVGYVRDVLGVTFLWEQIALVMRALTVPPYRALVNSGHDVGKTHGAACVVNWWYDTRDPGVVITTAPTQRDVVDLLWTEVRLQRERAGLPRDFVGARAPEMRTSEDHYAKGYTSSSGESFQGRHRERMLFVFDEAEGVAPPYWTTTKTMFDPDAGHAWLAIGNPTTTTSQSYLEESSVDRDGNPAWRVFSLSALSHPNIVEELAGRPRPVPSAVSVGMVDTWVADWCDEVPERERQATDFSWRGRWYRPGPIGESRILGLRPSAGTYGVWSAALWLAAETTPLEPGPQELPEIGCDVARFGDDSTEMHVRAGGCSLHHEAHNGWDTVRTTARLRELADEWAAWHTARRPKRAAPFEGRQVAIKVDDDGVGGGVVDQLKADGYNVTAVVAQTVPARPDLYPRKRDELWFAVAQRAREGRLDLTRLGRRVLHQLKRQAMAPEWAPDASGRRQVERKVDTKEKIGRSPDGMDALDLAYCEVAASYTEGVESGTPRKRLYGR